MRRFREALAGGRVLVADGAWGTQLIARGLEPGACPELWCLERREVVLDIARRYVAAGAALVETNSFGASRLKLAHWGLAARAAEINEAAAAIAREAAGPDRLVLGSMGPTGKLLLMGDVSLAELHDAFREQAMALARGGVDALCVETMMDLEEACVAVRAARESTGLAVACTFAFHRSAAGGYRTAMGVSPTTMAARLPGAGADVIGANCGVGIAAMPAIVREIRAAAPRVPILVQANAGAPESRPGGVVYPDTPASMVRQVPEVIAAGATIVGGCCGTTPEYIAALAAFVETWRRPG